MRGKSAGGRELMGLCRAGADLICCGHVGPKEAHPCRAIAWWALSARRTSAGGECRAEAGL